MIEFIIIIYAVCLHRKITVEHGTQPEIPTDETIQIPWNLPEFTVTVNDNSHQDEDYLELSEECFLAMEEQ